MIEYVHRNHIATNEALHRAVCPEVSVATAQKLIAKLIKRGLLTRWPLFGSKSYLRLGPAAVARWRYQSSLARRLGPQVLPYLWGTHSLTSKSTPSITRLLPNEIAAVVPGFPESRDLQQWAFYTPECDEAPSLGMIRVEFRTGGFTVVNKLAEQLHRYRGYEAVHSLINSGRLFVHVVTATPEQEQSLWEAADQSAFPVPLITCHDPQLTMFL